MRSRFGKRKLSNPLGYATFPFSSVDDAEAAIKTEDQEMKEDPSDAATEALEKMAVTGGAAGKFKKKEKKKKGKKKF